MASDVSAMKPVNEIERLASNISFADIDGQLEKVVQKSLVFILQCPSEFNEHRKKLMEILGDVTRRLKSRPNIQLPVQDLFECYRSSESTFLVNFSHMYICLGFPRLPHHKRVRLIPLLFACLTHDKPIFQRDAMQTLLRFDSLSVKIPDGFNGFDLNRVLDSRTSVILSAKDLEKYKLNILKFLSQQMLPVEESIIPVLFGYADNRHSVVTTAAQELRILSVLVDWEDKNLLTRILAWYLGKRREFDPKGMKYLRRPLSISARIKLGHYLLRSRVTLPDQLTAGVVEAAVLALEAPFLQPIGQLASVTTTNASTTAVHASPAAAVPQQPTACQNPTRCPNYNHHQQPQQSVTPQPEAIDHQTATQQHNCLANPNEQQANRQQPAPLPQSPLASPGQLRRLADHGLDLLQHLLDNSSSATHSTPPDALSCLINFVCEHLNDELTSVRVRGFDLLTRFLSRDPIYLLKESSQLPRLFEVLSDENTKELKVSAVNCLRKLALSLQDAHLRQSQPSLKGQWTKLERLLYENIEKTNPLCRLVAVNFAGLIYPTDHIPTRYLILQALDDKDPHVRAEACVAFEQFFDPIIIHDISCGRVKLPPFVDFVNHDTKYSKKNPFVEVDRLIPVVQFIRLCLLATLTSSTASNNEPSGFLLETDDEVRFVINRTVRYFLTLGTQQQVNADQGDGKPGGVGVNFDQAKRSVDTYFRLIQLVILTRSQHSKDSPDCPAYLEEVLACNTKELNISNKPLFDHMINSLLIKPKGANCRHACASAYSLFLANESSGKLLQAALGMVQSLPSPVSLDLSSGGESPHAVQGLCLGAAYLLERLFNRVNNDLVVSGKKKAPKQSAGSVTRQDVVKAIERLVVFIEAILPKLVTPSSTNALQHSSAAGGKQSKRTSHPSTNQQPATSDNSGTLIILLDALSLLLRTGCLEHLAVDNNDSASLSTSKRAIVDALASFLPVKASSEASYLRVGQAALRALAACCMGAAGDGHPHASIIIDKMVATAEFPGIAYHLTLGSALADCLLGSRSPMRLHWYDRPYPLIDQQLIESQAKSALAKHLTRLGHQQDRQQLLASCFWLLELVRRLGGGQCVGTILSPQLLTVLLKASNNEPVQHMAIALFGLLYDQLNETTARSDLIDLFKKVLMTDIDKSNDAVLSVYIELYQLTDQVGRADLSIALSLLSITRPPSSSRSCDQPVDGNHRLAIPFNLASDLAFAGRCRRLARSLNPVLPRLIPRLFIRLFDQARSRLRLQVENAWLSLMVYTSSAKSGSINSQLLHQLAASGSSASHQPIDQQSKSGTRPVVDLALISACELVEAHFNAIVCEIKTQLGFNTPPSTSSSPPHQQSTLHLQPQQDCSLRDACCLAIVGLTGYPSADKRLAGHLPALLSGLLNLCDDEEEGEGSNKETPAKQAALAVQKLVLRIVDSRVSFEAASGLLPGLLPLILDRAPWQSPSLLSHSLALELLVAVIKATTPVSASTSLRPSLPHLILACLQAMPPKMPSLVSKLLRLPIGSFHQHPQMVGQKGGSMAQSQVARESQLAQVLAWCLRLVDDACLTRLIVPLTELIRSVASNDTCSESIATATCVFISSLACNGNRQGPNFVLPGSCVPAPVLANVASDTTTQRLSRGGPTATTPTTTTTTKPVSSNTGQQTACSPNPYKIASSRPISSAGLQQTSSSSIVAPHTGKLLAALLSALPTVNRHASSSGGDTDHTVQIEMSRALASLLRFAKDTSVAKVFIRVQSWFICSSTSTDQSSSSQWACAHVMRAILLHCPDLLSINAGLPMPLLFLAKQESETTSNGIAASRQLDDFLLTHRIKMLHSIDAPSWLIARRQSEPPITSTIGEPTVERSTTSPLTAFWRHTCSQLDAVWPNALDAFVSRPTLLQQCLSLIDSLLLGGDVVDQQLSRKASLLLLELANRLTVAGVKDDVVGDDCYDAWLLLARANVKILSASPAASFWPCKIDFLRTSQLLAQFAFNSGRPSTSDHHQPTVKQGAVFGDGWFSATVCETLDGSA